MNNKTRMIRIMIAAVLAVLFAGSGAATLATALGLPAGFAIYLTAALAAALCGMAAASTTGAIASAVVFALTVGGYAVTHLRALGAIGQFFAQMGGGEADPELAALGGRAFISCAALALGGLFFLLIYRRELMPLAVMILLGLMVCSHAMSETASIPASVPGLVAAAAAFAFTGMIQRDGSAWRVLIPAALAAALALCFLPVGRVTWRPMEDLAARVRSVFEQYFNFTHERVAFSISEKGYNYGGEVDGRTVIMLGGPATPDGAPVMRVTAGGEALLRGTIRATYTGYSWTDAAPKNRYLYYDITHRGIRDRVFDLDFDSPSEAFHVLDVEVEMLDDGTSTLFVPARLSRFDMDLANAVYYNSSGEMFMAREAQAGDRYSLQALIPEHGDALRQATLWGEADGDDQYAAILAAHTELPEGIEEGVYALTIDITRDAQNAYERAEAIANYLSLNMRYRLDVEYPPAGRDFVSWFVLDSKEGYCSYFASAMAVMGRIAGLPTRYVEGYLARPGADGTAVLTGENAHAWAEVYFKGVGWIAFDPTNGGPSSGEDSQGQGDAPEDNGDSDDSNDNNGDDNNGDDGGQAPEPSDEPDENGDDGQDGRDADTPEDTPTPSPEPDDQQQSDQTGTLDNQPDDAPSPEPDGDGEPDFEPNDGAQTLQPVARDRKLVKVLLLILLLLLLALLVAWWIRRRLRQTDPVWLCRQAKRAQPAAMIAYRANLTLLAHMGQGPVNGEAPETFVARIASQFDNPAYERFVHAVALSRYGGRPLKKQDVEDGLSAYLAFKAGMSRTERLRFAFTRVFRGLGDFESIP